MWVRAGSISPDLNYMITTSQLPRGTLIAIGGHEERTVEPSDSDKVSNAILRRFVEELRGGEGPVVVVPTASEYPREAAQDYLNVFGSLGVAEVVVFDVNERPQASAPAGLALLRRARGVMFTGGDQLRLTALLGGTPWLALLKARYAHEELLVAGTSAGAACMGTPMIYQGRNNAGMRKDEIHVTTGLSLLPGVAVDTHFVKRGRIVRMAQVIATNPGYIGLGLEEDTGVVVKQGRELEVIGSGLVTVVEGRECASNIHQVEAGAVFSVRDLRLHLLGSGERYTLPEIE